MAWKDGNESDIATADFMAILLFFQENEKYKIIRFYIKQSLAVCKVRHCYESAMTDRAADIQLSPFGGNCCPQPLSQIYACCANENALWPIPRVDHWS